MAQIFLKLELNKISPTTTMFKNNKHYYTSIIVINIFHFIKLTNHHKIKQPNR